MNHHGIGDAGRYPCTRCEDRLTLAELLDHIEAHTSAEMRTQGVRT